LSRRGLGTKAQVFWHGSFWGEGLGFGLAGLVLLAVPVLDFLAIPALIVGGTRLALELEEPPAGDPPSPAGGGA